MPSAYNRHPEFGYFCLSSSFRRKAGLALAFIVFGSIAGASGVVMQIAGHEPDINGRSVTAAMPLNSSATLSASLVSTASPAASAPNSRQDSASPSNSAQGALVVNAITTAATEPDTLAATETSQQSVAPPKKRQKTAHRQNRRDRGWYDAYAWRQPRADYGRGRGYGHDYWRAGW